MIWPGSIDSVAIVGCVQLLDYLRLGQSSVNGAHSMGVACSRC
jgi:hypothetical protein